MHTICSTYLLYIAYHTPRPVKLVPRPPRPAFVACTASLQYKRQKLKAKSIASHSNDYTTTRHNICDVTVAPSAQLLPFPNTPSLHSTPRHTPSLSPTPRHYTPHPDTPPSLSPTPRHYTPHPDTPPSLSPTPHPITTIFEGGRIFERLR